MPECSFLYKIINNATFATVIGVIFATFLAKKEYSKQKNIDRDTEIKKDIINDLVLLQEKSHYILLIIDRIANTFIKADKKDESFFEKSVKSEIPNLSIKINDEIPALNIKIKSKIDIYFENVTVVQSQLELFRIELKKWHEFVVNIEFNFKQRVEHQPKLSLVEFDSNLKKLIKFVWKCQINHQEDVK